MNYPIMYEVLGPAIINHTDLLSGDRQIHYQTALEIIMSLQESSRSYETIEL